MAGYSIAKMYAAGSTSDAAARRQGGVSAMASTGAIAEAERRRRRLLEQAVQSGKVKPEQLGPNDSRLLGLATAPATSHSSGGGGGLLGKIAGGPLHFLGNLGSDIGRATLYLVPGLYQAGKAAVQDTWENAGLGPDRGSHFKEDVIDPTLKGYGETYGHGPGHFLKSFYEHPLGPILDVASVASLGGSAAARAGGLAAKSAAPGSRLSQLAEAGIDITSREGRAPFVHPASGSEIPREYTPRPVAKGGQRALDFFTKTGSEENWLGRRLREHDQRFTARRNDALIRAGQWDVSEHAMQGLEPIAKLTPDEATALTLLQKGINTPQKISAFQKMVHDNGLDEEQLKSLTNSGIEEDYIRHMGTLPDAVKQKILQPTERMIEAHQVWKERVLKQQDELGIDPARAEAHLNTEKERLAPYLDGVPEEDPTHGIEHVYVPSEEASGFKRISEEGKLGRLGVRFGREDTFRRGPTDKSQFVTKGTRYDQSIFVPRKASHEFHSTGETFAKGAFRTDARMYLDSVAKRSRESAERVWKTSEFRRIAAKDDKGDVRYFSGQKEVDDTFGPGKMVFVNDDMPIIYFRKEQDLLKDINNTVEQYIEDLPDGERINPLNHPDLEELLNRMTEEDAKAFIKVHWGSIKRKGGAIPKEEFEYRMRMASLDEPFRSPVARLFTRFMHRWRTFILTLMPRWGVNTALGSLLLNSLRGVDFRDYFVAQRLHKAGYLPENLAQEGWTKALPTGANLGHQATQELLEAAAPGYGEAAMANFMSDLGIRFPTRAMAQGVQNVENYFRRAAFIHNLRREYRLGRDRQGRTVDLGDDANDVALGGLSEGLQKFYQDALGPHTGGRMAEMMANPQYVQRALQETDKMMYNYAVLGPFERRIVRQFIPFWGWYKFISMAAYRLPVEYPGRMNLVRMLGEIGSEQEKDYGPMPDWLKGSIPFDLGGDGKFTYLSTFGSNPFAQVFNPLGPKGPLQGALTLGQLNPVLQSGLLAYGIDPLTGDRVNISPESGVGEDWAGNLWKGGHEVAPFQVNPIERGFMGLLRSFPEYRMAERYAYGPQFPESVPFLPGMGRQMAPNTHPGFGAGSLLVQSTGLMPKDYNLVGYQSARPKRQKYAEKQVRSATKRLRSKLKKKQ